MSSFSDVQEEIAKKEDQDFFEHLQSIQRGRKFFEALRKPL